jgi:para-nitrobenzyl esterase
MLAMPQARGLFQKAVLQSGAGLAMAPDTANRVMSAMLADVGLASHEAGRLRDLPSAQLLEMQNRVTPRAAGIAYGPVADGVEIAADLEAAVAAGSSAGIPMLIGTTLEEQKFFSRIESAVEHLTDDDLLARLADPRTTVQVWDNARFDPAEAVNLHRQAAAARGEDATPADIWTSIMSERRFRVPAMRLAELHAAHTPQTYAYLFTWRSPGWDGKLGAGHVVEVPFVFGTLDAPDAQDLVPAGSPVGHLSEQMQDAWIAFARTGSPQTAELSGWEPYTPARRTTMLLGTACGPVDAPYEAERHYWATRAGPVATHPPAGA